MFPHLYLNPAKTHTHTHRDIVYISWNILYIQTRLNPCLPHKGFMPADIQTLTPIPKNVNNNTNTHVPPWPAAGGEPHTPERASTVPAAESPGLQPELSSHQLPGPGTPQSKNKLFCFLISKALQNHTQNSGLGLIMVV